MRDSIRRDLEVALQSLSFLERFGDGLDSQRRLFIDFPRVTEELRTGAMERLAGSMEHLYDGGQGALDLARFLRDLPLALGHLAQAEFAAHRQKHAQANAANKTATASGTGAPMVDPTGAAPMTDATGSDPTMSVAEEASDAHEETAPAAEPEAETGPQAGAAGAMAAHGETQPETEAEAEAVSVASEHGSAQATASTEPASTESGESATSTAESAKEAVSPRVELRTRLLAAAPQLNKAAQSYRRNAATVRRAAAPRRAVGPWRSDREVIEQARRAIEFANKIYDAYAEAWNDAPLAKNAGPEAAAEMDRFLAWTQLSRYGEVARTQPATKVHEAAPGVMTEKPAPSQPPPAPTQSAHEQEAAQVSSAPESSPEAQA